MISLMRGTPRVTFMEAMPAKWNVLSVICVPGSPMLCRAGVCVGVCVCVCVCERERERERAGRGGEDGDGGYGAGARAGSPAAPACPRLLHVTWPEPLRVRGGS